MFRNLTSTMIGAAVLAAGIGFLAQPIRVRANDGPPPQKQAGKEKPKQHSAPPTPRKAQPGPHKEEARRRGQPDPHKERVTPGDRERITPRERERVVPGDRERVTPGEKERRRAHPKKTYIRTRDTYRHVRLSNRHRREGGRLHIRPAISRSVTVLPSVLDRLEGRRQQQIGLIIQYLIRNDRGQAIELWGRFIHELSDYPEIIDLDDVILYILRESCVVEDETLVFYGMKLEHLSESLDQMEDYIYKLHDLRGACGHRGRRCTPETLRDIETELTRARGDRDVLEAKLRMANDEYDNALRGFSDYERRFEDLFEDMYNEVEIRIRISG